MDKKILEILVCPLCKGKLHYDKPAQELLCRVDRIAFPIRDDTARHAVQETHELRHETSRAQR